MTAGAFFVLGGMLSSQPKWGPRSCPQHCWSRCSPTLHNSQEQGWALPLCLKTNQIKRFT